MNSRCLKRITKNENSYRVSDLPTLEDELLHTIIAKLRHTLICIKSTEEMRQTDYSTANSHFPVIYVAHFQSLSPSNVASYFLSLILLAWYLLEYVKGSSNVLFCPHVSSNSDLSVDLLFSVSMQVRVDV